MPRRDLEYTKILSGQVLNVANVTTLGKEFPLATGYLVMNLRINLTLVAGNAANPIAGGELQFIKKINLITDAGEVLCNLPGAALFEIALYKSGTLPRISAIAAADDVYNIDLPVFFYDPMLLRPFDTVLDTSRYNQLNLEVTLGSVADLFGTPGTATVTATLDVEVLRTSEVLPDKAKPVLHINYEFDQPVDANNISAIEIARSQDLTIKRLLIKTGSTGQTGVAFSGIRADDVIDTVSIEDHNGFIVRNRIHEMIQDANKLMYSFEAARVGIQIHDFVADGSMSTALYTGDKSKIELNWINKTTVAADDIVTVVREGARTLKG